MKRFKLILIVLLAVFMCPTANALIQGRADDTLSINESFNDNTAFAGNIVTVDSKVDGLGFAAGNMVTVKGSADYGFVAGNTVTVTDYNTKDLFVAGNNVTINNVNVRSIYAAGSVVSIKSNATTVYVGGANVTLDGEYENLYVDADEFIFNGKVTGTLTINEKAKQTIKDGATIAKTETYKDAEADVKVNPKAIMVANIFAKIMHKLMHMVSIIALGMLFIVLFKKTVAKLDKAASDAGYIFARFGFGFLALIVVPIIGLILTFTGLFTAIGICGITVYCLAIYLSEIVGTYYIGRKLFKNMNNYLAFLVTSLIVSAISLVPFVGGLLSFFMLCMSLGLIINLIGSEIKGK